jgi:hypothetical protein
MIGYHKPVDEETDSVHQTDEDTWDTVQYIQLSRRHDV